MANQFRVTHAEIRVEGLIGSQFWSELDRSWVPGAQVTRYRRTWRLSRPRIHDDFWSGHLGFVKEGQFETLSWNEESREFVRAVGSSGVIVPFIVCQVGNRYVVTFQLVSGLVKPTTVTGNLTALLNNEGTARWAVDAVGIPMTLEAWRSSVERVSQIRWQFTYPNPNWTGRERIEQLMEEFRAHKANVLVAAEADESLDVSSDWFSESIAHVRAGHGTVRLTGPAWDTDEHSKYIQTADSGWGPAMVVVKGDDDAVEVSPEQLRQAQSMLQDERWQTLQEIDRAADDGPKQ